VCIYICMYALYIYMYIQVWMCIYKHIQIVGAHVYMCTQTNVGTCTGAYTHASLWKYTRSLHRYT